MVVDDLGVAHPLLDLADVGLGDHAGAERVAEVVEAQRPERGARERRLVAAGERRAVEVAAGDAREDEVVVAGPALAVGEAGERAWRRRAPSGPSGRGRSWAT